MVRYCEEHWAGWQETRRPAWFSSSLWIAFAVYRRGPDGTCGAHAVVVLTLAADAPGLFPSFGLPLAL